jgi:hypothetical protein
MNKLIRGIGCFVLTCILFACPVCLTLLFALGKTQELGFITMILIGAVCLEFITLAVRLFYEYDTDD